MCFDCNLSTFQKLKITRLEKNMKLKEILKKTMAFLFLSGVLVVNNISMCSVNAESYDYTGKSNPSKVSNLVVPTVLKQGQSCSISGTVTINNPNQKTWYCGVMVYDAKNLGKSIKDRYSCSIDSASEMSNPKSYKQLDYDLAYLDADIVFGSLAPGKYGYTVYSYIPLDGVSGRWEEYYTGLFVVSGGSVSEVHNNNTVLTNIKVPSQISEGNIFKLSADVNITYNHYKSDGRVSRITYPHTMFATAKEGNKTVDSSSGYFSSNGSANSYPSFSLKDRTKSMPKSVDDGMDFNDTNKFKKNHTYTLSYSIANYRSDSDYYSSRSYSIGTWQFRVR